MQNLSYLLPMCPRGQELKIFKRFKNVPYIRYELFSCQILPYTVVCWTEDPCNITYLLLAKVIIEHD